LPVTLQDEAAPGAKHGCGDDPTDPTEHSHDIQAYAGGAPM